MRLDICICTFRRPSLDAALASIAAQRLPEGVRVRVIVADNDAHPVRRDAIIATGVRLDLDLLYVHAPAHNISVARNACLDAAEADWIAFIDDDEQALPDWVACLLGARDGAQVVFGVSRALYSDPAIPRWVRRGDFHSNRIAGNDAPHNGYTANVLIDRRFVIAHGLRFDPALGQTGGEDSLFFRQAFEAGARFGYAPDAVVTEETPRARATLGWLARRRFRSGQIHWMLARRFNDAAPWRIATAALAKLGWCLLRAALSAVRRETAAAWLLRGMLHAGVLASALGARAYREYAPPRNRLPSA